MAEKQNNDCVSFKDVLKSYPPGEHLAVSYELQADYTSASRDWVGLFQVGWTSSRDYYTFEWAPSPEQNKGFVTFAGRRLPPEDSHFYQFCYVSSNGRVRGASPPFQFTSASLCKHNVDDLELVEVTEDSLMVLQQKNEQSSEPTEAEVELTSFKESVANLQHDKKELNEQLSQVETERQQQTGQLREKDAEIADLQRQLQVKHESEQRLMEKLDRQRADNNALMSAKSDEDAQLAILTSQFAAKDNELSQQANLMRDLEAEMEDMSSKLQVKDSQIEDLTQLASARGEEKEQISAELERVTEELLEMKGRQADLLEQVDQKTIENEQLVLDLEEARAGTNQEDERVQYLQQELDIARQNISELMGQREGEVVDERPVALPEPPTAPAPRDDMVDRTVYESLLEAFENVQKYYEDAKKENQALALRSDELYARVEQCRLEYEEVARQNSELKRRGPAGLEDNDRICELEEQLDEITEGCQTAVTELTARKEELKHRNATISDLEETIRQVQQELESLQDRHDTEVHRRTEAGDIQKAALDKKIGELEAAKVEIASLANANGHLKAQLEGLKSSAKPTDRTCPICSTKFPARMKQQDFENHVQGHFRQ